MKFGTYTYYLKAMKDFPCIAEWENRSPFDNSKLFWTNNHNYTNLEFTDRNVYISLTVTAGFVIRKVKDGFEVGPYNKNYLDHWNLYPWVCLRDFELSNRSGKWTYRDVKKCISEMIQYQTKIQAACELMTFKKQIGEHVLPQKITLEK